MSELKHITILTGAGISAESGIPVFRSETGLWEQHRVEDVATYEGFARNPELVHAFYNKMRSGLSAVEPNVAHNALVKLAAKWPQVSAGGSCTLITQNIDDLHERAFYKDEAGIFHAGRKTLPPIHMHGLLLSARCEHWDVLFLGWKTLMNTPNVHIAALMPCGLISCGLGKCRFLWMKSKRFYVTLSFLLLLVLRGLCILRRALRPWPTVVVHLISRLISKNLWWLQALTRVYMVRLLKPCLNLWIIY